MEKFHRGLKFSRADRVEKSPDFMTFQPKLKLKLEVNPGRNWSVDFVVLAICIFPRLLITFSARADICSCDYMEFLSSGNSNRAETFFI